LDAVASARSAAIEASSTRSRPKQFMQPVRGLATWLQTRWSTIRGAREQFAGQFAEP
jgi:hypothetical protein